VNGLERRIVLDASAALEWILGGSARALVDKLLPVAVIPSSGLTEVLYIARLRGHGIASSELAGALMAMGAAVEPVITQDAIRASDLIAAGKAASSPAGSLSLGDGLCIAVAERLELPITGGDLYWETLDLRVKVLSFR
jgi:ribonuclease VapC